MLSWILSVTILLSFASSISCFQQPLIRPFELPGSSVGQNNSKSRGGREIRHKSLRSELVEFGQGYYTSPFKRQAFGMSDFSFEGDDVEDDDLAYLPISVMEIPTGTESMLRRITDAYIKSDLDGAQDEVKIADVLDVIEAEFKYSPVPIKVGDQYLKLNSRNLHVDAKNEASHIVSKVLSFALLHRLPATMTNLLFINLAEKRFERSLKFPNTSKEIRILTKIFEENGWNSIEFPQGISLRIKRDYLGSQFRLWPRKTLLTRNRDFNEARKAIQEANEVQPPSKLQPQQISIDEFVNQLNVKSEFSKEQNSVAEMLTFFPNRERFRAPLVSGIVRRRSQILSTARAVFVAYSMIAYFMYTFTMISNFRQPLLEHRGVITTQRKLMGILHNSMQTFYNLFVLTYLGTPKLSKIHRLLLSGLFAPFGNIAYQMIQRKLKTSANQAIGFLACVLISLSIGLWCTIMSAYILANAASFVNLAI